MPEAVEPWNVTEQLPLTDKIQFVELNEPPVPVTSTKVTVPVGVLEALVVSVTVAAQDDVCPAFIEPGVQVTAVDVWSSVGTFTVIVAETALLLGL